MTLVVLDLLHFIELFSTNEVRWWSGVIWSVGIGLYVWG